ncbi:MAG: hypothetical protein PHQ23_16995 [Candidatus Wallbacteria bacterium]|nr:hypothetical protein [Candidatus Wallbacteria bacterium]
MALKSRKREILSLEPEVVQEQGQEQDVLVLVIQLGKNYFFQAQEA